MFSHYSSYNLFIIYKTFSDIY